MPVQRGFGIAGALDTAIVAALAREAEQAGYASFWANDTPTGDGLVALAAAQNVTSSIWLGVGVIPVDRKPAELIASQVVELGLRQDRLFIGIGSGGLEKGALDTVRSAAQRLRDRVEARVVVGALGPRMCQVAGEAADGALLNWLTANYLPALAKVTTGAAQAAAHPKPWIGAYVRVALAGPAQDRLRAEAERYERYPAYAAHFRRMGVRAIETCVVGDPQQIEAGLNEFPPDADEIVVRAIAADETFDSYLEVLKAGAPKEANRS
jgi:alkanesulfonate monooxygenase SsuD/methylene tetrahydromethanopterin reductase-like flavin-dependent oxidoreductase (luciferase family)